MAGNAESGKTPDPGKLTAASPLGFHSGSGLTPDEAGSVKVTFEGTESARLTAIERSAQQLLAKVFNPGSADEAAPRIPEAVWSLRESVWPALDLPGSEFKGWPRQTRLGLLPLARLGQMEGKSGSLVLIGRFEADELGGRGSHPLVVKTQGQRSLWCCPSKHLQQEFVTPAAATPLHGDAVLARMLFQQR